MIFIKNNKTGETAVIKVEFWDNTDIFNHQVWTVIGEKGLVQVYEQVGDEIVKAFRWEKGLIFLLTGQFPDKEYIFEDLPDWGTAEDGSDLYDRGVISDKISSAMKAIKNFFLRSKDNLWAVTVLGGLLVIILGTWILVKIGIIK